MQPKLFNTRLPKLETRADGEKKTRTLTGYAAVFYDGTPATEYRYWDVSERIEKGAFDKALKDGGDVLALFNHDTAQLLGRTASGTLKLSVDAVGLRYEVDVPDTALGRDIATLVERGDISGSSFAFSILPNGENITFDKTTNLYTRTITDVVLYDVSPVTVPAYQGTTSEMRSAIVAAVSAPIAEAGKSLAVALEIACNLN
jgi:HK97 family phage prohead protease